MLLLKVNGRSREGGQEEGARERAAKQTPTAQPCLRVVPGKLESPADEDGLEQGGWFSLCHMDKNGGTRVPKQTVGA